MYEKYENYLYNNFIEYSSIFYIVDLQMNDPKIV